MNQGYAILPIFVAIWIILCILSLFIFTVNNNASLKRKLWPVFLIGGGILMLVFTYITDSHGNALYFAVPALILVVSINIYRTKFCDACGKTNYGTHLLSKPNFCAKCGEKLS